MIQHQTRIGNVFGPVVNWAKNFDFEMAYRTIVQSFGTAIETRESILIYPRIRMSFTAHFMGEQAEDFISEFTRRYDEKWFFPLPFRRATVRFYEVDGVIDKSSLYFANGVPFWARVGGSVIVKTDRYRELAHITGIDLPNNRIMFGGDMFIPNANGICFSAIPVSMDDKTAAKLLTLDLYEFPADIWSEPTPEQFPIQAFVPDAEMSGQPVYVKKPNWRNNVNMTLEPDLRNVDFGFGKRYQKLKQNFVASNRKMSFMFKTASEFEGYISFFHAMKGRRKPFWYPEWGALLDLDPTAPVSSTYFYPTNQYLGRDYSGSRTHRNLYFKFWNGTWAARPITEFNVVSPPNSLRVAPALPMTLTPNNLERATWLTLNRFGTDNIEFRFETSEIGTFDMNFKILQTAEVQA